MFIRYAPPLLTFIRAGVVTRPAWALIRSASPRHEGARHAVFIASLVRRSVDPATVPAVTHQAAADLLPDSGCHLPTPQEAPGEQYRMWQRAYPVPSRYGSLNASSIKTLAKRDDLEGRLHP